MHATLACSDDNSFFETVTCASPLVRQNEERDARSGVDLDSVPSQRLRAVQGLIAAFQEFCRFSAMSRIRGDSQAEGIVVGQGGLRKSGPDQGTAENHYKTQKNRVRAGQRADQDTEPEGRIP